MKLWISLVIMLGLSGTSLRADTPSKELSYRFKTGDTRTFKLTIETQQLFSKMISGAIEPTRQIQETVEDMTLETVAKNVDKTGNAEIQVTFKAARKMDKIQTGAQREPQPPDTFKFLIGQSLTIYVTADGKLMAVEGIMPLVAGLRDKRLNDKKISAQDKGAMTIAEQDFTEDFFLQMLQHLFIPLPLDPADSARWETTDDVPVPRTQYKLRQTTQSSLGRVEADRGNIRITGRVTALPSDPDAANLNPSLPVIDVLSSSISGDAVISLSDGLLNKSQVVDEITLRTLMRVKPPSARGSELRVEVITKKKTVTTLTLTK